jgi:hypothetical protein
MHKNHDADVLEASRQMQRSWIPSLLAQQHSILAALVKVRSWSTDETQTARNLWGSGTRCGALTWVSPVQLRHGSSSDVAVDLVSVGALSA